MNSPLPLCPKCKAALSEPVFNRAELTPCPQCAVPLQVELFPALFRRTGPGRDGEAVMVEGESSCFYHPLKKAVVACEGCGRFLCGLCDCELQGQHFCPTCLETGRKKGKITRLQDQRTLYDSIALALATLPILIYYFTIVTAPMAIYVALRYWNAPTSLVHRTKIRFVMALLLATLQLAGWGVGIYWIAKHARSHG